MSANDDLDELFVGFDAPDQLPPIPAARQLEAAIDDEAIGAAAAQVEYDVTKFAVPSPFECKDALKHLGCRWNSARKVWVARNAEMQIAAYAIVDKHNNRRRFGGIPAKHYGGVFGPTARQASTQPGGLVPQKYQAPDPKPIDLAIGLAGEDLKPGDVVYVDTDGKIAKMKSVKAPDGTADVDSYPLLTDSDERLASELRKRGYTVAKLGVHQTLAELLAEQVDEDPFEGFLEELNR